MFSSHDPEDRIRVALGVRVGPLPEPDPASVGRYCDFLKANLSFPFSANYPEPDGNGKEMMRAVTVVALLHPTNDPGAGGCELCCAARTDGRSVTVPLAELQVDPFDSNHQLIEDYWYWSWNFQHQAP